MSFWKVVGYGIAGLFGIEAVHQGYNAYRQSIPLSNKVKVGDIVAVPPSQLRLVGTDPLAFNLLSTLSAAIPGTPNSAALDVQLMSLADPAGNALGSINERGVVANVTFPIGAIAFAKRNGVLVT